MNADKAFNLHAHITDHIAAAIEAGVDTWQMPWRSQGGALHRPRNVASGKHYQGVNTLALWVAAETRGFTMPLWGTYRQWQAKGGQVRKGEKGAPIVFYKELDVARTEEGAEGETGRVLFARASWVFNAAQVDGYDAADDVAGPLDGSGVTPLAHADALIRATGADIREGGDKAFYHTREDYIAVPDRSRFIGSASSTPTDAWYATHLHELTHWSGAKQRLDRDLGHRFGSEAYAMEELIAELGSAFLCADLGLDTAPRPDHAAYVAHWLKVLKADKRAIFTAASQADKAARFLLGFADPAPLRPEPPAVDGDPPAYRI